MYMIVVKESQRFWLVRAWARKGLLGPSCCKSGSPGWGLGFMQPPGRMLCALSSGVPTGEGQGSLLFTTECSFHPSSVPPWVQCPRCRGHPGQPAYLLPVSPREPCLDCRSTSSWGPTIKNATWVCPFWFVLCPRSRKKCSHRSPHGLLPASVTVSQPARKPLRKQECFHLLLVYSLLLFLHRGCSVCTADASVLFFSLVPFHVPAPCLSLAPAASPFTPTFYRIGVNCYPHTV